MGYNLKNRLITKELLLYLDKDIGITKPLIKKNISTPRGPQLRYGREKELKKETKEGAERSIVSAEAFMYKGILGSYQKIPK